ncbi:MAG: peptidase T [Promethearchaeota archaeon]
MSTENSEVIQRFLRYVKIHTTSIPDQTQHPSSKRQFNLANLLVSELKELGLNDANVDEKCVVLATLPSNIPENNSTEQNGKIPILCLNAHMDTAPDESGENVNPQIITYQGGDIILPKDPSMVIKEDSLPFLKDLINTKIITTDGTTLLGADDKSGVAEIMSAVSHLQKHPEIKHGTVKILFTPDEEIGTGPDSVDLKKVGADFGFTIDGGRLGEASLECFNAAGGVIEIKGYNVHPGHAYGLMRNSLRIIKDVLDLFPDDQAPETTKDHEAYFHPYSISGDVNLTKIGYIIRSFDADELNSQIEAVNTGIKRIQEKYQNFKISITCKKGYRNMKEIFGQHPEIIEILEESYKKAEVNIEIEPIRGGTDGARFSFRGMPTPNVFTGGFNYHSKKECASIPWMEKAVEVVVNLITITAERR